LHRVGMRELEREFFTYAMAQAHPFVRECAGATLKDNVLKAVQTDVDRIYNVEFAKWHGHGREEFDVAPEAFNNRLIQFGPIRTIAGIRFRNRDSRFPFISIEQSSNPIGTIRDSSDLLRGLQHAFAPFRPHALSFFHSAHLPLLIPEASADYHVMIAPVHSMAARAPPPNVNRLELAASDSLGFYDRYMALYSEIFAERPWARATLRVEDRESLQACLAEGLLFDVYVDGAWCGIIAGIHSARGGINGIEIVDIILARNIRGAGLGVAAQWRFADLVCRSERSAVIWGTISDKNVPMRKTAERAGRVDVGATLYVKLSGAYNKLVHY
jgi:hypothetical protein